MEEPDIRDSDYIPEPPEGFDDHDYGADLIEAHVEAVEMRDARQHSARVERHRPPRRRRQNRTDDRGRRSRREPRDSYADDDQDSDDNKKSGGRGIFRYGAAITLGIAAVASVSIVILFALSFAAHVPDPSIEIKPRSTANDNYSTIQPKPQATRPPVVNTTDSRLRSNRRQQPR